MSDQEIIQEAKRLKIPEVSLYKVNDMYLQYVYELQQENRNQEAKHRHQPLQALYFDSLGTLQSMLLNCYAYAFPNMNWNKHKALSVFPPRSMIPPDSAFHLSRQWQLIAPVGGRNRIMQDTASYTVVVYWNRFMGRQTKRMIRAVRRNIHNHGPVNCKLLYVNNDNYYTGGIRAESHTLH